MTKPISNFFARKDFFGHKIELKFNNRGSRHGTVCGGLMSILLQIVMLAYLALLVKRLVLNERDYVSVNN